MKFLSDILARAGLVVDGTVTLNSVANATTDTDKFLTIDSGVVKFRTGAQLLLDIGGQVAGSYVPTSRILTINGTAYDLSADRSWTITAGVSSVSAGTGISVNSTTGAVTVTNTGLLSATAGSGISVTTTSGTLNIVNTGLLSGLAGSGISVTTSSGALTITNTGILSALAGSGISVTTSSGTLTINNTGLLSGLAGSGISVTTSSGALTITNTGLLSAVAGAGISVSTTSGTLTITNTITNNNQLTNGADYATTSYVTTQINNLVAGAPGLLDTLDELAAALGDDPNFATTITTALSNRLRIDINTQGLTSTQQGNGRTNLGLGSLATLSSVGNAQITDVAWSKVTGAPAFITGNQTITLSGDATGSGTTAITVTLANSGVTAGTYTKVTVDAKGRVTTGASLASGDLPTYTGTLTSSQVTTALGYTPYNSTNPNGYITSSSLSSYLPLSGGTVTGTTDFLGGSLTTPAIRVRSGGSNWSEGISIHPSSNNGYALLFFRTTSDLGTNTNTWAIGNLGENGTNNFGLIRRDLSGSSGIRSDSVFDVTQAGILRFGFTPTVGSNTIWHAGNLTNLNQLTNGPGYITSYTETDTLQSVVSRGRTAAVGNTSYTTDGIYDAAATPVTFSTPHSSTTRIGYHDGGGGQYAATIGFLNTGYYSGLAAIRSRVSGEANDRFTIYHSGLIAWGEGGASALDTNLYRDSANLLKTDDAFYAGGSITTDGNIYISNNGGRLYFDRLNGATVGAVGWHSNDVFYVAGHPDYGPGAGNHVRLYGFGADLHLGSANAGDVITINNSGTINANYPIIATGGSGTTPTLRLDRNIATPSNYYTGLQLEVRATSGTAGIGLHRNGYSHVGIYHDSTNELKFNMNSGTVILPAGAGTLWGSGNLTNLNQLSNGPGYITSNQTITLTGNVTGSGTTSIATTIANGVVTNAMLVNSSFFIGTTSISLGRASAAQNLTGVSIDGTAKHLLNNFIATDANLIWQSGVYSFFNGTNVPGGDFGMISIPTWGSTDSSNRYNLQIGSNIGGNPVFRATNINGAGTWYTFWHSGNLTNLNQLTNGPGYITSSGSISGNAATATSATQVVTLQDNPPSGVNGQLWFETDTLRLKVYSSSASAWIDSFPMPDMALYYTKAGGAITGSVVIQQDLTVNGQISADGVLKMNTTGTSYIRMGRFPQSLSNSGEAWIGRAADRSTGTMTVQLGGSSSGSFFEVVDHGWTTVTLKVGMNDFSYKGNTIYHAGNLTNLNQLTNGPGYITSYTETDTLASVTGRGATTSTPITITASEGREVAVYMPSSYTTDDLVSGHEYGWYNDHWRLGMTRSGGAAGADFVVQWNGARRLSLTSGGNLTVTSINVNSVTGSITSSGNGDSNAPFRFGADYSGWMTIVAGTPGSNNGWGLFWAGNSGAQYGTNGTGGPGDIWTNSGNPNEYVFVGNGQTNMAIHGNTGNVWIAGTLRVAGTITGTLSGNASTATNVAWTGVTGRPTALSQFTNDLGNYGGWITSSGSISGNAATATNSSQLGGWTIGQIVPYHSGSDFVDGTLVVTNIDSSVTSGDSFVMEVTGKSYQTGQSPFGLLLQGYIYANTFINCSAMSYGTTFPNIVILNYSGNLAFWWPRISYWNSFSVSVREAGGSSYNRVTSIGNSTEPSSAKKVTVTPFQVIHSGTIGSQSVNYATTAGALTSMNISQFTNNSGYITGYTETDTLATVTGRGASTSTALSLNGGVTITGPNAWNAATPMLNIGGTGDGRLQVRHIWGKSASSAGTDHLWLQYGNTGNHVQIGDSGGGNNLYVSGNIYMGGYFAGNLVATQTWVTSQGYVTASHNHDGSAITTGTVANARTTASSSNGTDTIVLRNSSGYFDTEGIGINKYLYIGGYRVFSLGSLGADGTQAKRFEIARLGIDYNDWNSIGTFEVELHESYYSTGLKKVYNIWYGYVSNSGLRLVEYRGAGSNNFRVVIGSEVVVSGDHRYLPVYVEVQSYSGCHVVVRTNRFITTNSNSGVGSTYIFTSPSGTNISNFSADGTPEITTASNAQIAGNTVLHAGNYNSYSPTLTGGGASGTWGINITGSAGSASSASSATSATQVVTIQDTPPSGANGKLWWESDTGRLKVYYSSSSAWVDATPVPDMSLYYPKAGGSITGNVTVGQTLNVVGNVLIQGTLAAVTMSGPIRRSSHLAGWFEGTYNNIGDNSYYSNPIYTIGSSYNPAQSSLSGMYGIGYSHPNFWGAGKVGGWGLYVASAGVIDAIIGGDGASTSIWAKTDIVAYSDARVKENVQVVENALEKIQAIRGVTFTRNDVKDTKKRSAGVIAQEVLAIFPEVVTGSEEDMYSVAYGNMAALFIEAIKEQQGQISELKNLVNTLTDKLNNI